MRYKLLGKSGLRVSELCLGTMTFGEESGWGANRQTSKAIFDAFREAGGNFIDTANVYTGGTSERFLAEFIAGCREEVVLATKFSGSTTVGVNPNAGGNHRKNMVESLNASLKRLNTDYVDLYWLHVWDQVTPMEEVLRAFDDMVRAGKVLYVGVSDTPAWVVSRAQLLAELRSMSPFAAIQIEYSLNERTGERELLPMARELGLSVLAWSPLAAGLLSGKYKREALNPTATSAPTERVENRLENGAIHGLIQPDERSWRIVDALWQVAKETDVTPSQVALAWLRCKNAIPIMGARTVEQVRANLKCTSIHLQASHMQQLDEASKFKLGFPYELYRTDFIRTMFYAGMRERIDSDRLRD